MDTAKRIYNVLFISVFATMLGLGVVSPLLPIYAENLGATGIWLGIIFSAFALSRSIFMPIIGRISDRQGRKWIILIGMFAYAALSLAYLIAGSVYSLTAVRFAHGIASAMVVPIAMAYIADLSEKGKEGSHMGNFSISMFLGMGVGPLLGGFLNDAFGMPSVFYVMAG
ncbi:MFS transporter, partial [Methanoculleus bourgensis]